MKFIKYFISCEFILSLGVSCNQATRGEECGNVVTEQKINILNDAIFPKQDTTSIQTTDTIPSYFFWHDNANYCFSNKKIVNLINNKEFVLSALFNKIHYKEISLIIPCNQKDKIIKSVINYANSKPYIIRLLFKNNEQSRKEYISILEIINNKKNSLLKQLKAGFIILNYKKEIFLILGNDCSRNELKNFEKALLINDNFSISYCYYSCGYNLKK